MRFTGSVAFRPVRVGFLIDPQDITQVSRAAQLSACIWGGRYNPIIPFLPGGGERWVSPFATHDPLDVTRGFVSFFEPDLLVESEPGMADAIGWQNTQTYRRLPSVLPINRFYEVDSHNQVQFAAGIDILEVMRDLYDQEYRYELRNKPVFAAIAEAEGDAFFDVVCGRLPPGEPFGYLRTAYKDAFTPETMPANFDTAYRHLTESVLGPLYITSHELEESIGDGWRDHTFFVFDPKDPGDALDYWNFRLIEQRVVPINVNWFADYLPLVRQQIAEVYRPIPGNPFGTMFRSSIYWADSIGELERRAMSTELLAGLEDGAAGHSHTPRLWRPQERGNRRNEAKIRATGKPVSFDENTDEQGTVRIPAPAPQFENKSGRYHRACWINVVVPANSEDGDPPGIVYPTNLWAPKYPALAYGEQMRIGREGWILTQEHALGYVLLRLQRARQALIDWLKTQKIAAVPSEAGQIAAQVIRAADGLRGSGMFADRATLMLLGDMAESHSEISRDGVRVQSSVPERSKHINTVRQHFTAREKRSFGFWNKLDYFLERSVFRAGLRVACPVCGYKNWFDLNSIGYRPTCTRCLNEFAFDQSPEKLGEVDWFYRVIGPFAAPDYARGGYSVALTLRCLGLAYGTELTWSTGLELRPLNCEVDFMAWYRGPRRRVDERDEPQLIIGEAKSFGRNALNESSIANLKKVAERFPGAFMVVSSLRPISEYVEEELKRLCDLARWGRSSLHDGEPRNPLVILTATELFAAHDISAAWKDEDGGRESVHSSIDLRDLGRLAELTQHRYLGLVPYWREQQELRSHRQRLARALSLRGGAAVVSAHHPLGEASR